jgi:branched-chain amino acid aminotransferase
MANTAKKAVMVAPPVDLFVDAVDQSPLNRFIPLYGSGASLYVRPLLIGITGTIGSSRRGVHAGRLGPRQPVLPFR